MVWTRYSAFNARHTIIVDKKQLYKDGMLYFVLSKYRGHTHSLTHSLSLSHTHTHTHTIHPDFNYGIVIDAGSSSSKLQLFQWPPHDGNPTKLLNIEFLSDELGDPLFKKVEPGKVIGLITHYYQDLS